MTEREYLLVANLTRLRAAAKIIQDILDGYGLTVEECGQLLYQLDCIIARLAEEIEIEK